VKMDFLQCDLVDQSCVLKSFIYPKYFKPLQAIVLLFAGS